MCEGEDRAPPRRVFTPLLCVPPLKHPPNGHDLREGIRTKCVPFRTISLRRHGNCSIYRQETDSFGEDAQMKKTLITVAMDAMALFMAAPLSTGAKPDTATWETPTWAANAYATDW